MANIAIKTPAPVLFIEVLELQKAGISVHYLPYPRGGNQGAGYQTLVEHQWDTHFTIDNH